MTDPIQEHQQKLIDALADLIRAEQDEAEAASERDEVARLAAQSIAEAKQRQSQAWATISSLMAETGEVEVILPGSGAIDYKIGYTQPRESIKVTDPEAVPDHLVKLERKPKLKEIGEWLRSLAPDARPNWATIERGEAKLNWSAIKRKGNAA